MIKRTFLVLLSIFIVCFIAMMGVLNSASLTQRALTFVVKKNLKGYELEKLAIDYQELTWPGELDLRKVFIKLKSKDGPVNLSIKQLHFSGLNRLIFFDSQIAFRADGISFDGNKIVCPQAEFDGKLIFNMWTLLGWQATIGSPEIRVNKFKFSNISALVDGFKREIFIRNIKSDFYKGHLNGNLRLVLTKQVQYLASINAQGVDISALKDDEDALSQQIEGVVDGSISILGNPEHIDSLAFKIKIIRDGRMRASLLKFVMPYLKGSGEAKYLQGLINKDQKVPVEAANFELKSLDSQKLSGVFNLGVRNLNLDLSQGLVDILFDGNIFGILKWYQRIKEGRL
jgi:hypothetical protein